MDRKQWIVLFALALAALSAALFTAHYLIFRDLNHLAIYTLHDIAFLPLEVLIVTMVIHSVLESRERQELVQKLNMVIDAFYSEAGIDLLSRLSAFDVNRGRLEERFNVTADWTDSQLAQATALVDRLEIELKPTREGALELREQLLAHRQFLLRLLENPSLLEDEAFTDVLWAVFHLGDELQRRQDLLGVPDSDFDHLTIDMERAYRRLIVGWLQHVRHLKKRYPYLYSIALRTNPLIGEGRVEVLA